MTFTKKLATIAVGAAVLAVPATALASSAPRTARTAAAKTSNLQISLRPSTRFHRAIGSADYQSQPGQSEFQVELNRLLPLAGKRVLVQANGKTVGWAKVSSRGVAQLSRNTELRQNVPAIVHGSTVRVKTSSGVLIASGVF